ncbi:hypothetical protein PENSPDRAFT_138020 [Peniophora sp. CONT]|nr:hypothetical protein PENSPDRAFT_138020 [Peniophora sp. CONT]
MFANMISLGGAPAVFTACARHSSRASLKDNAKKFLGVWNLAIAATLLRSLVLDALNNPAPRSTLSLFLGALYVLSLLTQFTALLLPAHLRTMQADLMLSLSASLALAFGSVLRTAVRAALGEDLLGECVALASGQKVEERLAIWGPAVVGKMNEMDAAAYCRKLMNQGNFFETIVFAASIVTVCFAITLIVVNNIEEERDEQAREALLLNCDLEYEFDKPASVASSPA